MKIKGLCESEERDNSTPSIFIPNKNSKNSKVSALPIPYRKIEINKKHKLREFDLNNFSDREEDVKDDDLIERHSSDEDSDGPLIVDEGPKRKKLTPTQSKPLNMSSHGLLAGQVSIFIFGKKNNLSFITDIENV